MRKALAPFGDGDFPEAGSRKWRAPVTGPESGFRNKAKMVVGGTTEHPTLGILDPDNTGVDLRECGLYPPLLSAAFPVLADFISSARIEPYDVRARRGELKHIVVTVSPDGELMVRFVLRSTEAETRIRKHLPDLRSALPSMTVASINIHPDHKAVLTGDREILLTDRDALAMRMNDHVLYLYPQGFFQTNTEVAAALYREAAEWVGGLTDIRSMWDLYCGVGGFALHCARPGVAVTGVEVSADAIGAARRSAREAGCGEVLFDVGDATSFALGNAAIPDVVVVNPPRRGLGGELTDWLENSTVPYVLYSSCNPASLAGDMARMPSLRLRRGRYFDMFPQTTHGEVLVLLERDTPRWL